MQLLWVENLRFYFSRPLDRLGEWTTGFLSLLFSFFYVTRSVYINVLKASTFWLFIQEINGMNHFESVRLASRSCRCWSNSLWAIATLTSHVFSSAILKPICSVVIAGMERHTVRISMARCWLSIASCNFLYSDASVGITFYKKNVACSCSLFTYPSSQ